MVLKIFNNISKRDSKENIDELWKELTPKLNKAIKQMNEQK